MALAAIVLLAMTCPWSLPLLSGSEGRAAETPVTVEMMIDPPGDQIIPDTTPARLTFTAAVDGKPLDSGHLTVQVSAPPRPMLLLPAFLAVAGTTQLQLATDLRDGTFAMEYLFPRQGDYALDFDIVPVLNGQAVGSTKIRQHLPIQAGPAHLYRGWLFSLVLFCLGGILGAWYARRPRGRTGRPSSATMAAGMLMFGSLVAVTVTLTFADHGPRELVFPKGAQVVHGGEAWSLEVRPIPEQAVVGELLRLNVTLTHQGQVFSGPMEVAMHVYNLRDDQTVLRTNIVAPHGSTSQRLQLSKSAPHTCTVTARPIRTESGAPVALTAVLGIDVAAAQTSITAGLRVVGLWLGVVGAGMASGFLLSGGIRQWPGREAR
jgi:hypothetical protein